MFSRAILMSGSMFPPHPDNHDASEDFVRLLTCDSVDEAIMLQCLQSKSYEELLKAYESIVRNENRINRYFGPTVDSFIDDIEARTYLNVPFKLITELNYTIDVPILMGITSNEGAFVDGKRDDRENALFSVDLTEISSLTRAFIAEMLVNYGKQGYRKLRNYIETSVLPMLLRKSHFDGFNKRQVGKAIRSCLCDFYRFLIPPNRFAMQSTGTTSSRSPKPHRICSIRS